MSKKKKKKKKTRRRREQPAALTYDKWLNSGREELESLRREKRWQYSDGYQVNEISLTYAQLAARSGLCVSTVSRYLRGLTKKPSFRTVFNLYRALGKEISVPEPGDESPMTVTQNRMLTLLRADKAMDTRLAKAA